MCAQTYRVGDPYRLAGNRLVFSNWHYVLPGDFGWYDEQGNDVRVKGEQNATEATFGPINHPWGIHLSAKKAVRSGPIFEVENEWEEGGISISTIIKDGDIYKAWGSTDWGSSLPDKGAKFLTYYESKDGYHWERPNCGLVHYKDIANTNLLLGPKFGGNVFIDPTSTEERYKYLSEAHFSIEEMEQYLSRRPGAIEGIAKLKRGDVCGIKGAVSTDGLNWTILPEPLAMTVCDTLVVGYFDTFLKKYVVYSREWAAGPQASPEGVAEDALMQRWGKSGRRAINRAESEDFRNLPLPESIIEPDPLQPPNHVLYTNCRTEIPGAPDHHLMFPSVWTMGGGDNTYIQLYTSQNGKTWSKISVEPMLKTADFGEWDGGCIFAYPNLLELPNGDFALPYMGWNVPHKYPRVNARRNTGYALWSKGRLVGLSALESGEFTTVAIIPPGQKLFINALTERAGSIRVEALNMYGEPVPGREFVNALPIVGDAYLAPVVWKDHDRLGMDEGQPVMLRFKLCKAEIFFLEFR